jgi:hypothetical protein
VPTPTLTPTHKAHLRDVQELTDLAAKDLAILFRQFDSFDAARAGLSDVLPQLVAMYGSAAATLGADWYDDLRDAAELPGRFRAIPAELPDHGRTDSLARWAASQAHNLDTMLPLAIGGTQRIIANADRESVRFSSLQDPRKVGWVRMGVGECDWCKQYLDGEVHYTTGYGFDAHDNCRCFVAPHFG